MGQQETTMTVAEEEKGGGTLLRRTILALLVAALMAATMSASASPAKADVDFRQGKTSGLPDNAGDFDQSIGSVVNFGSSPSSGPCVQHFGNNFGKKTGGGC